MFISTVLATLDIQDDDKPRFWPSRKSWHHPHVQCVLHRTISARSEAHLEWRSTRPSPMISEIFPSVPKINIAHRQLQCLRRPHPSPRPLAGPRGPSTHQSQPSPWPSSSAPTASPQSAQQDAKHRIKQRHCLVCISALHRHTRLTRHGYDRLWKKVRGRKDGKSGGRVDH